MTLSTPKIRVIHVTTHIGLVDAICKINPDPVERTFRCGHEALVPAGIPKPKIGVSATSPKASDMAASKATPAIPKSQLPTPAASLIHFPAIQPPGRTHGR